MLRIGDVVKVKAVFEKLCEEQFFVAEVSTVNPETVYIYSMSLRPYGWCQDKEVVFMGFNVGSEAVKVWLKASKFVNKKPFGFKLK
jgi:hypothetical protein